jgi:hypothetical protein
VALKHRHPRRTLQVITAKKQTRHCTTPRLPCLPPHRPLALLTQSFSAPLTSPHPCFKCCACAPSSCVWCAPLCRKPKRRRRRGLPDARESGGARRDVPQFGLRRCRRPSSGHFRAYRACAHSRSAKARGPISTSPPRARCSMRWRTQLLRVLSSCVSLFFSSIIIDWAHSTTTLTNWARRIR